MKPAEVEERGGAVTRRPNSRLGDSKSSNKYIRISYTANCIKTSQHFILNFSFTRIVVRRFVLKISIETFNAYINYIVFRVANQGLLLASSLKFVYGTKIVEQLTFSAIYTK